jgi:hypothetical protein
MERQKMLVFIEIDKGAQAEKRWLSVLTIYKGVLNWGRV